MVNVVELIHGGSLALEDSPGQEDSASSLASSTNFEHEIEVPVGSDRIRLVQSGRSTLYTDATLDGTR